MNQTVKWLFVEEQGNSVVFRCSVCNSEIIVQYGEELPYCKHCESEPDGEQIAKKMTDNEIIKASELVEKLRSAYDDYYNLKKSMPYDIDTTLLHSAFCLENCTKEINRQKEQIESLISGQETLQTFIAEKDAEIEQYKADKEEYIKDYAELENAVKFFEADRNFEKQRAYFQLKENEFLEIQIKKAKSESVKECLDKIEQMDVSESDNYIMVKKIEFDNIKKEMVGE